MRKFRYILILLNATIFSKNIDAQNFIYTAPAIEDSWGIIDVLEGSDYYLFTSSDYNFIKDSSFCNLTYISKKGDLIKSELIQNRKSFSRSEFFISRANSDYLTQIGLDGNQYVAEFIETNIETRSSEIYSLESEFNTTFNDILKIADSLYFFGLHNIDAEKTVLVKVNLYSKEISYSSALDAFPGDLKLSLDSKSIILKGLSYFGIIDLNFDSVLIRINDFKFGDFSGDLYPLKSKEKYINFGGQSQDLRNFYNVDFGLNILDKDFNILKNIILGRTGDTIDIPARTQSIASTNGGFYFGGTSNFKAWEYPYGYEPSWFMIMKTDSALNLEWTKEYGGDAYYFMTGITATSDGGGIAYGTRQDTTKGNFNRDPFMIKFDKNGMITFTKTFPQTKKTFAIYPNPASNVLNVKFKENLITKFIITNTEGKVLKEILRDQIDEKMDISNLLSGVYFISGYNKNLELIGTQKLIVKK